MFGLQNKKKEICALVAAQYLVDSVLKSKSRLDITRVKIGDTELNSNIFERNMFLLKGTGDIVTNR